MVVWRYKIKKITVIGDSITEYNYRAYKNWVLFLKENEGYEIQNLGESGTGFYVKNPYKNRIELIDLDADIIGVAISFNDLNHEDTLPIGTADDKNKNTICALAMQFFDELIIKFPNTKIIAYSQGPWGKYNLGVKESDEYIKNISIICEKRGLPFYAGLYYEKSDLQPWIEENRKKYYKSDNIELGSCGIVDSIHPNSLGHKIIYDYLKKVFKSNFD